MRISTSISQTSFSGASPTGPNYTYAQESYNTMNKNSSEMYYPAHLTGQTQSSQNVAPGGIPSYQTHQQPSLLHQQYNTSPNSYSHFNGYPNDLPSPQQNRHLVPASICHQNNVLPLPQSISVTQSSMAGQGYVPQQGFDMTGQIAPPGMKPRVTATLWEDEGSLCFQVEAKNICVARREDNHMINGTKLLNVAGMTRGRRDGILKSEKVRHVVKIGPMHLKGVWIPFERALDFANKEKITELLYPLFVFNINDLLCHPSNQARTNAVMAASERRKLEQTQIRNSQNQGLLSLQQHHHHHSMTTSVSNQSTCTTQASNSHSINSRTSKEKSPNFPTPPTSASSAIGNMSSAESNFQWSPQASMGNITNGNSLSIDTGLSNSRTLPSTPATTPPGTSAQGIQYTQSNQSYDNPRQIYQTHASQQGSFPTTMDHHGISQYSQTNSYVKNGMGPPETRPHLSEIEQHDTKVSSGVIHRCHNSSSQDTHEDERENDHDTEYTHGSTSSFDPSRPSYHFNGAVIIGNINNDHPISSELSSNSSHHSSGRATPRTAPNQQPYYSQQVGNPTSPRSSTSPNNHFNVMGSERESVNSEGNNESCPSQPDMISNANCYTSQQPPLSRPMGHNKKRSRDIEEEDEISISGRDTVIDVTSIKRRKIAGLPVPSYESQASNRGRVQNSLRRR